VVTKVSTIFNPNCCTCYRYMYLHRDIVSRKLVQAITSLALIQEMPGFNPVATSAILIYVFHGYPQSLQEIPGLHGI
jgi:hypothetical protein